MSPSLLWFSACSPTLPNIDRTTGRSYTVTVDSISVIITEYDLLYPTSD